jgi:hypothetical protein
MAPTLPNEENALLLPSSRPTSPRPDALDSHEIEEMEMGRSASSTSNDIMPPELRTKQKLTKVEVFWRIVFALFVVVLFVLIMQAILHPDSPDVSGIGVHSFG